MKKSMLCVFVIIVLTVDSCAFIRPAIHTLNDIARALCERSVSDSDKSALGGMTAKDWCAIQANLDPFIRALTVAQKDAMQKTGLNRQEVKP